MAAKSSKTVREGAGPNALGLVPVRFVKKIGNYQAADIAGFLPERAKALIDGGFAEPVVIADIGRPQCQDSLPDQTL